MEAGRGSRAHQSACGGENIRGRSSEPPISSTTARLVMYWTRICDSNAAGEWVALPARSDSGSKRGGSTVLSVKRNSATHSSAATAKKQAAATAIGITTSAAKD